MYAKLFASIYQGTLRGDTHGLVVFTNMLAHADSAGWVDIHPRAIAEEVGLSLEAVNAAILALESPDPESRSPEEEGRRIVRLDAHRAWGWRIVNHGKYRAIRSEEDRREQNRLAQERFRSKRKQSKPQSAEHKHASAQSAQAEAEAEAEAITPIPPKGGLPGWLPEKQWSEFVAMRKAKGNRIPFTAAAQRGIIAKLESMREAGHDVGAILEESVINGWSSVFEPKGRAVHQSMVQGAI